MPPSKTKDRKDTNQIFFIIIIIILFLLNVIVHLSIEYEREKYFILYGVSLFISLYYNLRVIFNFVFNVCTCECDKCKIM